MSSIKYFYASNYIKNGNKPALGVPFVASTNPEDVPYNLTPYTNETFINPYNTDIREFPLMSTEAFNTVNEAQSSNYYVNETPLDNTPDRNELNSLDTPLILPQQQVIEGTTSVYGSSIYCFGTQALNENTFGIAISTENNITDVTNLTTRLIVIPSTHAGQPTDNPLAVVSNFVLPIPYINPNNLRSLYFTNVGPVNNIQIINEELILYDTPLTQPLYYYPFLIANGWQFDNITGQWYVDVTKPIYWGNNFSVPTQNNEFKHIRLYNSLEVDFNINGNRLTTQSSIIINNIYGFEDLSTQPPVTDFNSDYNDFVFNYIQIPIRPKFDDNSKRVIYIDSFDGSDPSIQEQIIDAANSGFNIINLGFWVYSNINIQPPNEFPVVKKQVNRFDSIEKWFNLTPEQRVSVKNTLSQKRPPVKLIMSVAAGTENKYIYYFVKDDPEKTGGVDPIVYANAVVDQAHDLLFDGIDFDFENFDSGLISPTPPNKPPLTPQETLNWLVECHKQTRLRISEKTSTTLTLISHAPQAPYFDGSFTGIDGGYTTLEKLTQSVTGGGIDFYNVQYYNQGETAYITYNDLFIQSKNITNTSVSQVIDTFVTKNNMTSRNAFNKIVMGKPLTRADAGSGYVAPIDLRSFYTQYAPYQNIMAFKWNQTSATTWIRDIFGFTSNS